jgi:FtsP/CotA-like multicopper oxidase with cupredoxin domain
MLSNNDAVIRGSLREMSDEWLVVAAQDGNINAFAELRDRHRVVNATNEIHPFHIHQVHFLVYERAGVPVRRPEWMDTVNLAPNESLDLVMDFTDPIIRGVSVFHCHLLKHEDKGMMAKILFQ